MSTNAVSIESALIQGDLSKLSTEERLSYFKAVCESVGLNPLTKPFEFIQLNGKLTLYAKRDATDQLRKINQVSVNIVSREKIDDVYVVTAKAKTSDGREDESIGAVNITNLKGDYLANALMKAETKAKRRVTLSICGLGMLDETEVETIGNVKPYQAPPQQIVSNIKKQVQQAKQEVELTQPPPPPMPIQQKEQVDQSEVDEDFFSKITEEEASALWKLAKAKNLKDATVLDLFKRFGNVEKTMDLDIESYHRIYKAIEEMEM